MSEQVCRLPNVKVSFAKVEWCFSPSHLKKLLSYLLTVNSEKPYRPCLDVEIDSVHRICLLTDSVDLILFWVLTTI